VYSRRGRAEPCAAALTTGAVSTVFDLGRGLLFRPLDVLHPEEVVVVSATRRHGSVLGGISHPDYVSVRLLRRRGVAGGGRRRVRLFDSGDACRPGRAMIALRDD